MRLFERFAIVGALFLWGSIMFRIAFAAGLAACIASTAVHAAGDPAKGESKASPCAGCHQIPGWRNAYPPYRVPKLGNQHAEYIVAALRAYKAGERPHTTMRAVASGLSQEDMEDLAAYFAGMATGMAK